MFLQTKSPCYSSNDALLLLASLPCIAFYCLCHVIVRMFFIVLRHNMSFFPFLLLLCFMFELFTFGLFQVNRINANGRIWWGKRCAILELRVPVHFVFNCKMYFILKRQIEMQWTVSHLTTQVLHFYLWRPAFFSHIERGVTFNSVCFNVCIKKKWHPTFFTLSSFILKMLNTVGCARACMYVGGWGWGGGVMFDAKFVYVNIEYEIYTPGAHLRKGTLKPHCYYDDYYYWCCYLLQIF